MAMGSGVEWGPEYDRGQTYLEGRSQPSLGRGRARNSDGRGRGDEGNSDGEENGEVVHVEGLRECREVKKGMSYKGSRRKLGKKWLIPGDEKKGEEIKNTRTYSGKEGGERNKGK